MVKIFIIFGTLIVLVSGCSFDHTEEQAEPSNHEVKILQNAFDFIVENVWDDLVLGGPLDGTIEVTETTANMKFINEGFTEAEVLEVTYKGKENLVAEPPIIIVNKIDSEVIGYIPSE